MLRRTQPMTESATTPQSGRAGAAILLLAVVATLSVASVVAGEWDGGRAPFPFVWRDVAVVYLLSAVPLAAVLARFACSRLPVGGAVALAVLALAAGIAPLSAREEVESAVLAGRALGFILRSAVVFGIAVASATAVDIVIGGSRVRGQFPTEIAILGAVVLAVLPVTYVGARCRHDAGRLGEYLEQSRVGEARDLARGLLALGCRQEVRGNPLPEVAAVLERVARDLESRVGTPLSVLATSSDRLERARTLAMLGRTEEALGILSLATAAEVAAEVETLRGTILQSRGEWEPALEAFRKAEAAWRGRTSRQREQAVTHAMIGVAYCQRKLGQYAEAEATYREVLARSPTADSHFLLAQFYEDTQQTEKAREHARRAMALAPDRYQHEGERLIRKLTLFHFGCLSVLSAER
jgi:hypothetical protein